MGFGASVGLRRAVLGARSASAVGSEPGLLLPPHRGVQPRARPRPGQERRWVRAAVGLGVRVARSGSGGCGHRGRSPPPPAACLRSRGAGRVGAGAPPAGPGLAARPARLGQGPRGPRLLPGRPQLVHGPGAERPRGPRKVGRAGGWQPGPRSGLELRRSQIGRKEALDRLSHLRDPRPVRKSGPGRELPRLVAPAGLGHPVLSVPAQVS